MERFRVKVNLSEFFEDERKLSMVNVNTNNETTVQDVINKVISLFRLSPTKRRRTDAQSENLPKYGLFEDDFFIHPDETSSVLQDIGLLRLKKMNGNRKENEPTEESEEVHSKPKRKKRKRSQHDVDEAEEGRSDTERQTRQVPKHDVDEKFGTGKKKRHKRTSVEEVDIEEQSVKTREKKDVQTLEQKKWGEGVGRETSEAEEISSDVDFIPSTKVKSAEKRSRKSKRGKSSAEDVHLLVEDETEDRNENNKKRRDSAESEDGSEENILPVISPRKFFKSRERLSVTRQKKSSVPEIKSQVKEVSTSNVSFVDSDEKSLGRKNDQKSSESSNGSSVSEESYPLLSKDLPSKKRRRRHSKRRKRKVEAVNDSPDTMESDMADFRDVGSSKPAFNSRKSVPSRSNANLGSSHIYFESDEEEEKEKVDLVSQSCDGNDVEIVHHTSTPMRDMISKSFRSSLRKPQNRTSLQDEVIDVEEDDAATSNASRSLALDTSDDIRRRYSIRQSWVTLEKLNTLKEMSESGKFTVVNLSSVKETVTSNTYKFPDPESALTRRRDPPAPSLMDFEMNERTKENFQKLLALKNLSQPLLFKSSRPKSLPGCDDDEDSAVNDQIKDEVPDQSSVPCTEDADKEDDNDVTCQPSTSGYTEDNGVSVIHRPGPSQKSVLRSAPRKYHSLGGMLSRLRRSNGPEGVGEEELELTESENKESQALESENKESQALESENEESRSDPKGNHQSKTLCVCARDNSSDDDDVTSTMAEDGSNADGELAGEKLSSVSQSTLEEDSKANVFADKKDPVREGGIYWKYPLMRTRPRAGEYLAIKTMSTDENLQTVFSDYFVVHVIEVSRMKIKMKKIQDVEMETRLKRVVKDGVEEVDLTFEEEEEEVDLTKEDSGDIMTLDWRDIIEPRLLYP